MLMNVKQSFDSLPEDKASCLHRAPHSDQSVLDTSVINKRGLALARWLSGLEDCPKTPRLWVRSLVRAHTRINQ